MGFKDVHHGNRLSASCACLTGTGLQVNNKQSGSGGKRRVYEVKRGRRSTPAAEEGDRLYWCVDFRTRRSLNRSNSLLSLHRTRQDRRGAIED
jgi:hypothetical protein